MEKELYRFPHLKNKRLQDPHVVIRGAGASKAACRVDKNGRNVPLLRDIHKALCLYDELKGYGFSNDELENFEMLYSNIYGKVEYAALQLKLETAVREYFQNIMLA